MGRYDQYFGGSAPAEAPPEQAAPSGRYDQYFQGGAPAQQQNGVDKYHARAAQYLDDLDAQGKTSTGGVLNSYLHGLTAGVGNRFIAGAHAIAGQALANDGLSFPERMRYEVALEEEKHRRANAANPIAGTAAEIAGSISNPLVGAASKGIGALTASRFANAVGTGAVLGGTEGLMDTGSADAAGRGALLGAAGGGIGYGIGRAVEGVANRMAPKYNAPTMDQLAVQAQNAEDRFVNSGVTYGQPALNDMQQSMLQTLEGGRYSSTNHPNLSSSNVIPAIDDMVNRVPRPYQQVQPPVPYQKTHPISRGPEDIRDISRVIQEAQGGGMKPSENRLLGQLQQTVRDLPLNAKPADVLTGDSQAAGQAWREANDLYTRQFKTDLLREEMAKAASKAQVSGSGGNIDNLTRRAAMTVRDSRHDWTPDELAQIETIMQGDDSWLRTLGRAAPQGNGLMQLLHLGRAIDDPKQALLSLAAQAARWSTDNSTQNQVTRLDQLIRSGGNASVFPKQTTAQRLAPQLTPKLTGPFAQLLYSSIARPAPVRSR